MLIDNAEDLDIVMSLYNLLEYSHNCSMRYGSLRNYYRDHIDDVDVNDGALYAKSFKYKTKIVREAPERPTQPGNPGVADQPPVPSLNVEVTISLKFLWRSLDLPLINCEVELDLLWTKYFVLMEHYNNITGIKFVIASIKFYIPVTIFSINNNIKLLENMKQGFKRTISWD